MSEKATARSDKFRSVIAERFNELAKNYADVVSVQGFASAFSRLGWGMANQPQIQNQRVKGISSLPVDYTKEDIGNFLRTPYSHERELRETSEILRWTNYPYFKINKTYADIPTDRYYAIPKYLTGEMAKTKDFERELVLVDKLNKAMRPEQALHRVRGKALLQGKVVCYPRYEIDKSHNKCLYAFLQELPIDWCYIIGRNNVSGWTVSFDMMYFLQPGASIDQYGDLFYPYVEGFNRMFSEKPAEKGKYVYSSYNSKVKTKNGKVYDFYPENLDPNGEGEPQLFQQNGVWAYYVSLPIDKIWVYEIDDTTPAIIPPLAGMMLTYAQQSDFEEIQKTLYTNPLIKIFTGEIPYFNDDGTREEDTYKLSDGGRMMFQVMFDELMAQNNTAGTAFFSAPVENIKSHDFNESANANEISTTFNNYAGTKVGLAALIPVDKDIKSGQVEAAKLIEARYATAVIYPQFERMMTYIYFTLKLKYEWEFKLLGTIFTEKELREKAEKNLSWGDASAVFVLAALDGVSVVDKMSMLKAIDGIGFMDLLKVPETMYTQSGKQQKDPTKSEGGRPQTEGVTSEGKEHAIDAGVSTAE
jgi:hypothetical protein